MVPDSVEYMVLLGNEVLLHLLQEQDLDLLVHHVAGRPLDLVAFEPLVVVVELLGLAEAPVEVLLDVRGSEFARLAREVFGVLATLFAVKVVPAIQNRLQSRYIILVKLCLIEVFQLDVHHLFFGDLVLHVQVNVH